MRASHLVLLILMPASAGSSRGNSARYCPESHPGLSTGNLEEKGLEALAAAVAS